MSQIRSGRPSLAAICVAASFMALSACSTSADPMIGTEASTPASAGPASSVDPSDAAPTATPTGRNPGPDDGPDGISTPAASSLSSADMVDGDTIKVAGESVRIVGIDTPERGECGYQEASDRTAALISGGVVLVRVDGTQDRDVYKRLLRYVTTSDGKDLGTELLRAGLARARYDSLDGYPRHPKQDRYRAISDEVGLKCDPKASKTPRRTDSPNGNTSSGGRCDPNYSGACVPVSSSDLDCGHIGGPVTVIGRDRHNLDGDGDGRACEN